MMDWLDPPGWAKLPAARLYARLWRLRAVALGVRMIALDEGRVILVRHTYLEGWYLPGGGVDRGESAEEAASRELLEEAAVRCRSRPLLHGLYRAGSHGQVACYLSRDVEPATDRSIDAREIAEAVYFPLDDLPAQTTPATRARLRELATGEQPRLDW